LGPRLEPRFKTQNKTQVSDEEELIFELLRFLREELGGRGENS